MPNIGLLFISIVVGAASSRDHHLTANPIAAGKPLPQTNKFYKQPFYKLSLSIAGYCTPFLKGYRDEIFWVKAKL